MRVLKLAAIAILNVTPLTSAVEVDRKRSNVQYKSNEEEESAAYIGVAPEDERKLQDDMSMSMADNDMCSFCPDGLDDPAFVLPTDDAATCQEANNFANTLLPNDPSCDTVQLAESYCCKPEPETPEVGTIVDIAAGDDRFTTLVAAVTAAGLVDTLSGDGPFTVFAPTNDAFRALPAGALDDLLQNVDQLTSVLTYHVVSGKVASTDLVNGPVPTVNGADVTVDLTDGVKINDANVIIPDIEASNGIIHVIDKVLLPPMDSSMPDAGETTPVDPPAPAPVDETTDEAPVPPPAPAPVPVGDSAMFSKSSKSKAAKAKSAKAKTVKEKQAKTTKALEPMDAKAEKVSKSTKSKAAKAKTAKSSTKAVKATTLPAVTPPAPADPPADPAPISETTDEEPVPPEPAAPAPDAVPDAPDAGAVPDALDAPPTPEAEPTRRKLRNTNQK